MEFDRVDVIEKEWIDQGKKMDIDYIWLAHGKYIRENPDFNIEITPSKDTPHKYGFYETRKVISEFYNTYIFNKKNIISPAYCSITGGCTDGVKASLEYFKNTSEKNILFLIPTYQPLLDVAKTIFLESRIFFLKHFNEAYEDTLKNIQKIIKEKAIGCVIITNPNNPAGIMYPDYFLLELAKICNKNNIWVIEDGAYFLHYNKKKQTSILLYAEYATSNITAYKLLLSSTIKVGGAVLSHNLDIKEFSKYTKKISSEEETWFWQLLKKIALNKPEILNKHLKDMFLISGKVTKLFFDIGFLPLYEAIEGKKIQISIGPVISFAYKDKSDKFVEPEELFQILMKHNILTTPMDEGIRINSRGITKKGRILLSKQLKKVNKELKLRYYNNRESDQA